MRKRIAITGMGAVTPLGQTVEKTWEGLVRGRSGIGAISRFDASGFPCRIAGEIDGSPSIPGISEKIFRRLDPFARYALAACDEAMTQAGLTGRAGGRERWGVVVGTSRGGITTLESNWKAYYDRGLRGIGPHVTISSLLNQAPAIISQIHRLKGPSLAVSTACASGAHAIGEAARIIGTGEADVVITGGAEAPITPIIIGGFSRIHALSVNNRAPQQACRPFDRDRDGFVISEGAGLLVLEAWDHAEARKANILGELLGVGMSSDAYHSTAPDPEGVGMARSMILAMKDAGVGPDEIDLINAHGTGTVLNDRTESRAIEKALGGRGRVLPVCAVKSMTGHMLGASGAVEAIVSVLSARRNLVPPVRNLENPDPECCVNPVRGEALREDVATVLSSSFAFGGANAALVVRGFTP